LRLLLESGDRLPVGPAPAIKIAVMLVPVFAQPPPQVTACLMASEGARSHPAAALFGVLSVWFAELNIFELTIYARRYPWNF
jgi:hypothetical protein